MDLRTLRSIQSPDFLPNEWYNIVPDLPEPLPPMKKSDGSDVMPKDLEAIFPRSLVEQEFSTARFVKIPEEVRAAYLELGRPTPLIRARRLEEYLSTPARIYFKYEGVLPTGSHKVNTAVAQAYFNKIEGTERLTTETGADQWGSALALAGALFSIRVRVYMVRASYEQKPYRAILMRLYGAEVIPSPSPYTKSGRAVLERDPNHPGSLGIAISEAIEDALTNPGTKYSLDSVLNHILLHQTVIGLEALKQLEALGKELPDVVVGCVEGWKQLCGARISILLRLQDPEEDRCEICGC